MMNPGEAYLGCELHISFNGIDNPEFFWDLSLE
jgi:hypothetical protein